MKVSYHPRWRAEGADGPYLVSPALMMVVPRQTTCGSTTGAPRPTHLGLALSLGALGLGASTLARARRRRRRPAGPDPAGAAVLSRLAAQAHPDSPQMLDACDLPRPPRRWGWTLPTALWWRLPGRLAPAAPPPDVDALHAMATRAFAEGRFADAAEYAATRPSPPADGACARHCCCCAARACCAPASPVRRRTSWKA